MSQAITLPTEIANQTNLVPDDRQTFFEDKLVKEIGTYAHEVAIVAIIISDTIMKRLYKKKDVGYIACIDTIAHWAKLFVEKYAHVEEWEEFCDTQKIYKNISCWDDFVMAYAEEQLKNYE